MPAANRRFPDPRRPRSWLPGGLVALLGVALAIGLAGCGNGALAAAPCRACAVAVAQSSADAFAMVARRTYIVEVNGAANGFAFYVVRRIGGLVDGLSTRNYALARAAVRRQGLSHAVAVRVTRGRRTLINVGTRFVIAGRVHVLHGAAGVRLGRVEISTQDMVSYIGLIHRLTGCQVVVAGSTGQTKSSWAPAGATVLPVKGPVVVAAHHYTVSSFVERGFAGEPIRVSILYPTSTRPGTATP
jgi:hypothetical protein